MIFFLPVERSCFESISFSASPSHHVQFRFHSSSVCVAVQKTYDQQCCVRVHGDDVRCTSVCCRSALRRCPCDTQKNNNNKTRQIVKQANNKQKSAPHKACLHRSRSPHNTKTQTSVLPFQDVRCVDGVRSLLSILRAAFSPTTGLPAAFEGHPSRTFFFTIYAFRKDTCITRCSPTTTA